MNQRLSLPRARLNILAGLVATGAMLTACGGGGASEPASGASAASVPPPSARIAGAIRQPTVKAAASATATAAATPSTGSGTVSIGSIGTGATGTAAGGTTVPITTAGATAPTAAVGPTAKAMAAAAANDLYVYVETTGSDANSGAVQSSAASDGPVKTLLRGQQLARAKIAAMMAGTIARVPIHVVIGPGEYNLANTWTFNWTDSGTAAAPIRYEARQAGTVLISGGVNLTNQTAPSAAIALSFGAPVDPAAVSGGGQLFVNGRRAILARQPNAGDEWFVQKAVPLAGEPTGKEGSEAFGPSAANLSWIAGLSTADKQRAVLDIYQSWTDGRHRLSTQTTPAGSVRVAPRALWPFMSLGGVSQRYHVENVAAALDSAGEWIYDNGSLRYIRRNDEVGAQLKPTLPVLDRLVAFYGELTNPVQNVQFSGLTFGYTRYLTPDAGYVEGQAAYTIPAAIEVNRTRGLVFDNCTVYRTAGWGIWLRDGTRDSKITNSKFTDLGAGGIKVGLSGQSSTDTNATGNNQLINNTVSETGKVFPGAVGIWLGQTWDNTVQMNTIYNTTYTAISVGWSWGYAAATSGRNLIKGNLIYNIGQRQVGDISGIYTLGQSPGTVISYNIIRSIRGYTGYGAGAWGIYNDEGTTGVVMENNVILGTDNGAYHIHYGQNNIVRANVMAGGDVAEVRVTQLDTYVDTALQNNLIAPKVLQPFDQYAQAPSMTFSGNEVTPTLSGGSLVLTKCGTGCTLGNSSIQSTTNPVDIRSTNASWNAIIANAVQAWSGVAVGADLDAKLAAANLPLVADAPTALVAPAVDFVADIAGSAINSRPINLVYMPKGNTTAIRVETQSDAPNGKCLAFNDGATFANRWEPYTYAQLNYTSGTTSVDFEMKIDSSTVMLTEWRDNAPAYLTGPSMRITPAGVTVNNVMVAPVTVGAWTKFHVSSVTGTAGSKWSLEVTRSSDGQKTVVNNLSPKDAGWKQMNWLGFVSDTDAVSRPCVASIKATNVTQ